MKTVAPGMEEGFTALGTPPQPPGGVTSQHTPRHPMGLAALPPHVIFHALETFLRLFLFVICVIA